MLICKAARRWIVCIMAVLMLVVCLPDVAVAEPYSYDWVQYENLDSEYDFRAIPIGDTKEDVIAVEGEPYPATALAEGGIDRNSDSANIEAMQEQLFALGMFTNENAPERGVFDQRTLEAVLRFQQQYNAQNPGAPLIEIDPTNPDTVIDATTLAVIMDADLGYDTTSDGKMFKEEDQITSEEDIISTNQITVEANTQESTDMVSRCGENLSWTFDEETGTLEISGEGAMYNYETGTAPWFKDGLVGDLIMLEVADGVTSIGDYAFVGCVELIDVSLPDSIEKIGDYSFSLTGLTNFIVPANVTNIGEGAFYMCGYLSTFEFSTEETDKDINIGKHAFFFCTNLSDIEIPVNVEYIHSEAFYGTTASNLILRVYPGSYGEMFAKEHDIKYVYSKENNGGDVRLSAEDEELEYDFKQFRWGDSKEDIIAIEGTPLYETDEQIMYITTAAGLDTALSYQFRENELYGVIYILMESHTTAGLYIDDYNKIKEAIIDKYGTPTSDNVDWDTSRHKEYYSDDIGRALEYGYATYDTRFYLDRTWIWMSMSADNFEVVTTITYLSTADDVSVPETDYSDDF